jgi:uncharacterized protein (TIGR03437 family)
MKRTGLFLCLVFFAAVFASGVMAQTSETLVFRAILLPQNEIPPINLNARGIGTIWVHVVRDSAGEIVSGSVDFQSSFTFPSPVNITQYHVHQGGPTGSGGVVIDPAQPRIDQIQSTTITPVPVRQVRFTAGGTATDTRTLNAVKGLIADPGGYYYNIHSSDFPSGVMRGQLQRTDIGVFMGQMNSANEFPAIAPLDATAIGTAIVLRSRDANGSITSGYVIFDVAFNGFSNADGSLSFTGLHIHTARAGAPGSVTLDSVLPRTAVPATGNGLVHQEAEIDLNRAGALDALANIFDDPQGFYINIHTTVNPGGALRAQMRPTDKMVFQFNMSPANETPPVTGLDASAPSAVTVHTIRNPDGSVAAGVVIFDVNARFPSGTNFTAMHIHDADAGSPGDVTIDSRLTSSPILPPDGTGNIFRIVTISSGRALTSLNSLVQNPERHYLNLHTSANQAGAVRAQLAPPRTALPLVTAAISGVFDPSRTTAAPASLVALFGANMAKVGTNSTGFFPMTTMPTTMNGTSVTVGGVPAPIYVLDPGYMLIQIPVEATAGTQQVVVRSVNGNSTPFNLTVAAVAPNIFFDGVGGLVLKNSNFTLVRPDNQAAAGDILLIYVTGLGQTTSALATGRIVPAGPPFFSTSPVTVTIGGIDAPVIYSIASPGFAGLYQVAVRMPGGVPPGNAAVVVRSGTATSNSVNIAVR